MRMKILKKNKSNLIFMISLVKNLIFDYLEKQYLPITFNLDSGEKLKVSIFLQSVKKYLPISTTFSEIVKMKELHFLHLQRMI